MPSDSIPPQINTTVAHSARVYDYWLGGKDNFAADRALGDAMVQAIPTLPIMARANRAFLGRAVRYLTEQVGVRQFLDIGTGIPTGGNIHEVSQAIAPETRVLYVDHDPIVLAHARALMTSSPEGRTEFIMADLRTPEEILRHPTLRATLDLDRPVSLMLVAILMYFKDSDDPYGLVRTLVDALPSGSYLTITHPTADFAPEATGKAVEAATSAGITLVPRSKTEIERFFTGLEVVGPGVAPVLSWHSGESSASPANDPTSAWYYAGVARKP
ncbi:S-adenosyl methyltransferase [Sinosporangium album]|uniref:S-adenosyl methyltransferase n=1 Tax=Sinosporangium album TaxID=504805 RepID=A0A1G7UHM1_9ACTN|nr:SAM-dependent methyltransferase [Sinosporangium album]SDG47055.1 S-adenosyl methyltransferase [Sinosporangium album]